MDESDSDDGLSIAEIQSKMLEAVQRRTISADEAAKMIDDDYVPSDRSSDSSDPSSEDGSDEEDDGNDSIDQGVMHDSATEQRETGSSTSRKRQRKPDEWKRNKQKIRRQRGEEYVRVTGKMKGTTAPAKSNSIGKQLCPENCRFQCNINLSDDARKSIFDYYYSVDQQAKDAFLFSCVERHEPYTERRGASKHHSNSYRFRIKFGDQEKQICKRALCVLLGFSQKVVERIKKSVNSEQAGPSSSERGQHRNRPNKVGQQDEQYVIDHIQSFPVESSHYSRSQNPDRKYLPPTLSISKMYRLVCVTF